ncbi:hypothetical protein [Nitrogeniibacter aestuarii]|uniref:hypothetical protein n=1 Tax=Nitrogeniibacter aestuarii TaxID=2815343 RepID=UPI001D12DC08|nr:hypothetical protein [Nitrogeniibacter aestuarii]
MSDLLLAFSVFGALLAFVFSPLLVALTLVVRGGHAVPQRGAFILVGSALAYGSVFFIWLIVTVPVRLFAAYVYPQLGLSFPSTRAWEALWVLPIYRVGEFPQYVLPIVLLTLGCAVVVGLWRRWPQIARAVA